MHELQKTASDHALHLQTTPTSHQVQLTRLLATGLPKISIPQELVEAIENYIFQTWSPVLSSHEDRVLRALLALTIERGRRECLIDFDTIWPVVKCVMSSVLIDPFTDELYQGCPHESHEIAFDGLVKKGLVVSTIANDGWICSVNFLWNPEFEKIGAFVGTNDCEIDCSGRMI